MCVCAWQVKNMNAPLELFIFAPRGDLCFVQWITPPTFGNAPGPLFITKCFRSPPGAFTRDTPGCSAPPRPPSWTHINTSRIAVPIKIFWTAKPRHPTRNYCNFASSPCCSWVWQATCTPVFLFPGVAAGSLFLLLSCSCSSGVRNVARTPCSC